MKVINNYGRPLTLEGGLILAAAGTDGSTREVESISDKDRKRYVDRGLVAIVETQPAKAGTLNEETPAKAAATTARQARSKEESDASKRD